MLKERYCMIGGNKEEIYERLDEREEGEKLGTREATK